MNCTYCGGELADGAKFCTHCGRSLVQVEPQPTTQPQPPEVPTYPTGQTQPVTPPTYPAGQTQPTVPPVYPTGQQQTPPGYQPGQPQVPPTQYNQQQGGPQQYPNFVQPPMQQQQAQANSGNTTLFIVVGWLCFALAWFILGIPLSVIGIAMGSRLYQQKQGMAIGIIIANVVTLLLTIVGLFLSR